MPPVPFHERHYELAMNRELLGPSVLFFAPPTTLEAALGFDVVMWPGNPLAWPVVAGAALLVPAAGAGPAPPPPPAPPAVASLFLQYKRPEILVSPAAPHAVQRIGALAALPVAPVPYMRVTLPQAQKLQLQALEAAVGAVAVVRYAAAHFTTVPQFIINQLLNQVFLNSVYASPISFGGSQTWTYAVGGGAHVRHSDPVPFVGESIPELSAALREVAHAVPLTEHLALLARAVRDAGFDVPSHEALRAEVVNRPDVDSDSAAVDTAAHAAAVQSAATQTGTTWALLAMQPPPEG